MAGEVDVEPIEEIHAAEAFVAPVEMATREEGAIGEENVMDVVNVVAKSSATEEEDAAWEEDATVDINVVPNDNVTEG